MSGHGTFADRERPSWSKPLAPLADWLKSVDVLIDDWRAPFPRHPRRGQDYRPRCATRRRSSNHRGLSACWLARWRRRLKLSPTRAASLLGYASGDEILAIEQGESVKRDPNHQRNLVRARARGALRDRSLWLHRWRIRMGLSTRRATEVLGYSGTFNFYRAERGGGRPSWEKMLIAVAEERMAADATTAPPASRVAAPP